MTIAQKEQISMPFHRSLLNILAFYGMFILMHFMMTSLDKSLYSNEIAKQLKDDIKTKWA